MSRLLVAFALTLFAPRGHAAPPAEQTVEAPGPAGPLRGTMLTPPGPPGPVALIIPGSGPTDRDGNNPGGVQAAPYRLLGEGLAAHGVTTLRIDKRGLFGSGGATADPNAVTMDDYVADIRAWGAVLRQRTGASCLWLVGHSEGALVAILAARAMPEVCGVVLVAAPGRPIGEVLRAQLAANPNNAPLMAQAGPIIDALEAGHHVDGATMPPALLPLFRPQVQGFLISAFAYDPAQLLKGFAKPVLIIQGERDLQVPESDAQALKQADPQAELVLLPEANHVLKAVPANDVGANFASYANPRLPLAPGVVESISGFLAH